MTPHGARAATLACVLGACACDRLATNLSGGVGPEAGLLRGKAPIESRAIAHDGRLTDGIAAAPGDPWRTDLTAVLQGDGAHATWDLGADQPVRCALVDADGNDRYLLSTSSDGHTFTPLWTAEPDEDQGQQLRAGRDLAGHGRYLRLSAGGGDGHWSVSEVSAWSECPKAWPALALQRGTPDEEAALTKLWAFAALAVAYVLSYRARAPDWARLLGVVPAGVGVALAVQLAELWPLPAALAARVGAVIAAVGAAFALRRILSRKAAPGATP